MGKKHKNSPIPKKKQKSQKTVRPLDSLGRQGLAAQLGEITLELAAMDVRAKQLHALANKIMIAMQQQKGKANGKN